MARASYEPEQYRSEPVGCLTTLHPEQHHARSGEASASPVRVGTPDPWSGGEEPAERTLVEWVDAT